VQLIEDVSWLRFALRRSGDHRDLERPTMMAAVRDTLDACGRAIRGEGSVPTVDGTIEAHDEHARHLNPPWGRRTLETGLHQNWGRSRSPWNLVRLMI